MQGSWFEEARLRKWMCQMLLALDYLQASKVGSGAGHSSSNWPGWTHPCSRLCNAATSQQVLTVHMAKHGCCSTCGPARQ